MKDIITVNWGKDNIDLDHIQPAFEMKPTEIHLKGDGAIDDKPSFLIVMQRPGEENVFGQISLRMLNEALNELGYTIKKL